MKAIGYGSKHSFSSLKPIFFERTQPGPLDVRIDILYCGVCHSDVHQAKNEWKNTVYPCVPGHEIVGRVADVGSSVSRVHVGDLVGVGCMIDSCRECAQCQQGLEQYCEGPRGCLMTYNGPMKPDGTNTYGGYSNTIVVTEAFVLKIPKSLEIKAVAPLLCAGVTTYSPLKHWNVGPEDNVAVVGLGGLGHMAVKIAVALGAQVTVISTSEEKKDDAKRFGATGFVLSSDPAQMKGHELKFDFILNTIPQAVDMNPYVALLKRDGVMVVVGVLTPFSKATDNSEVAFHRRSIAGSLIGGIAETQEVLDFCGTHGITSDVEIIPISEINDAFDKIEKGSVRYRYVIDIANTLRAEA